MLSVAALVAATFSSSPPNGMPDGCFQGLGMDCPDPATCNLPLPDAQGPAKSFSSDVRQIQAPPSFDNETLSVWHKELLRLRNQCQSTIGYDGSAFQEPALEWTQTAYISPQMHPYDGYFFNPALGNGSGGAGYTVDKWLDDLEARYGGIDKALVWPTYTQIGIDDRSQFDMIRTLPGGPAALCAIATQAKARGVHLLWPYHPWDHETKGQQWNNVTDPQRMAELQRDTCFDGFNGDTMGHIPRAFVDEAAKIYKPIALEPEGTPPAWDFNYATVGWAEGYNNDAIDMGTPVFAGRPPRVDKPKWLTNGLHMNNWCERWAQVKIPSLQVAWFNGNGYESWENVWGTWNGITPRDGEAIRRVGTMLRFFGRKGFFRSPEWLPHAPEILQTSNGVYGSVWPLGDETVWTLVNRNVTAITAKQLLVGPHSPNTHYYDCYNGQELHLEESSITLTIAPADFACVLATQNASVGDLGSFLKQMATMTQKPLLEYSPAFVFLQQTMVPANATSVRPANAPGPGEVYVPPSRGLFHFQASGVEIEGGDTTWPAGNPGPNSSSVDVQFPWEPHPQRHHDRAYMHVGPFYADKHPVTNADYATYLKASGYRPPSDSANWLLQWGGAATPPSDWENRPVTYVSLNDARAYCKYYNKRLPDVHEWQYIAQGTDGRLYPWGNTYNDTREAGLVPAISNNFTNPGPEPVGKYPNGASPFGVEDLVGSVWQLTTEFRDERNRAVLLRGGSNYGPSRLGENREGSPQCAGTVIPGSYDPATGTPLSHPFCGSNWYFPPAFENNAWNKYFLMSDGWERAGTIGFRCIADAADNCTSGCPTFSPPESELILGGSVQDWVYFGTNLERAEGRNAIVVTQPSHTVTKAGVTSVSWANGTPDVKGTMQTEMWVMNAGLTVTAPLPQGKSNGTLVLYLSVGAGSSATLTATTESTHGGPGPISQFSISESNKVALDYVDGQLRVDIEAVSALPSAICLPTLCIKPETLSGNSPVLLSGPDVVDWIRVGGLGETNEPNAQAPWYLERMNGGSDLLNLFVAPSDMTLNKFEQPQTTTYSWTGGAPDSTATAASGGIYINSGMFTMAVSPGRPAGNSSSSLWRLSLHVGCWQTTCRLDVSGADTVLSHALPSPSGTTIQHYTILFKTEAEIVWGRDASANEDEGNMTFQAAVLDTYSPGVGIQAAVLV